MPAIAAQLTLDDRLRNFGSLVGLVLVLVVLFTNQRASAATRAQTEQPPRRDRALAVGINLVLLLVTIGLFAAGVPLVSSALQDPRWFTSEGALRDAFALVWLLLAGLLLWQAYIVWVSARSLLRSYDWWRERKERRKAKRSAGAG